MTGTPHPIDDEIWNAAFDWLMRTEANPDDLALAAALRTWLEADTAHAQAFEHICRTWQTAPHLHPTLADHRPPASFRRPPALPGPRPSRRQVLVGAGAMAAGLALYAGTGAPRRLFADISTATGEFRTVTLEDGTHVHMDTATAISLDFSGPNRRAALLGGRAYFDIARDAARPFAVTAGPAEVTVIGTRFDLRLDDDSVSVAVEHGRVAVGMAGRRLTPADGLVGRSDAARPGRALRGPVTGWTGPRAQSLGFAGQPRLIDLYGYICSNSPAPSVLNMNAIKSHSHNYEMGAKV